jgi:transposase-like protein
MLLAAADGLSGFPDAVNAVFSKAEVQLCIVHMVRNSVKYAPYKGRKAATAGLKKTCLAPSEDDAGAHWNVLLGNGTPSIPAFPNRG